MDTNDLGTWSLSKEDSEMFDKISKLHKQEKAMIKSIKDVNTSESGSDGGADTCDPMIVPGGQEEAEYFRELVDRAKAGEKKEKESAEAGTSQFYYRLGDEGNPYFPPGGGYDAVSDGVAFNIDDWKLDACVTQLRDVLELLAFKGRIPEVQIRQTARDFIVEFPSGSPQDGQMIERVLKPGNLLCKYPEKPESSQEKTRTMAGTRSNAARQEEARSSLYDWKSEELSVPKSGGGFLMWSLRGIQESASDKIPTHLAWKETDSHKRKLKTMVKIILKWKKGSTILRKIDTRKILRE